MDYESTVLQLRESLATYRRYNEARIECALDCGVWLYRLRKAFPHGQYQSALASVGLPARTARRWVMLARSGVDAATVDAAGGLRATEEALASFIKPMLWENVAAQRKALGISKDSCPHCAANGGWPNGCRWHLSKEEYRAQNNRETLLPVAGAILEYKHAGLKPRVDYDAEDIDRAVARTNNRLEAVSLAA